MSGFQAGCKHSASRMCAQCLSIYHPAWLSQFPLANSGAGNDNSSAESSVRNQKSCGVKVSICLAENAECQVLKFMTTFFYVIYQ